MSLDALVVGGGIAGVSAALALARAQPNLAIELLEQAPAFSEVGAGVQMGPNAVRVLRDWGLEAALMQCGVVPEALRARDARSGRELGRLELGARAVSRYGAPYLTVHRADLHRVLLDALHAERGPICRLGERVSAVRVDRSSVTVHTDGQGPAREALALLGCDGIWSRVRDAVWADEPARFSGHLAYRGLLPLADVPSHLRSPEVVAWLGPRLHAVHYPVKSGEWLNVVVVLQGDLPESGVGWDHAASRERLGAAMGALAGDLQRVWEAVPQWRLWPLFGRPPVRGWADMARGPVALLGDAAHPMRPYLAQGAAMAIEDAWVLGRLLAQQGAPSDNWSGVWKRWAMARWSRCAWVQSRSIRNGTVFHATGPLRWARDATLATLGHRVMDVPRLYAGPPIPE